MLAVRGGWRLVERLPRLAAVSDRARRAHAPAKWVIAAAAHLDGVVPDAVLAAGAAVGAELAAPARDDEDGGEDERPHAAAGPLGGGSGGKLSPGGAGRFARSASNAHSFALRCCQLQSDRAGLSA